MTQLIYPHFRVIDSISFEQRKSTTNLTFSNPTAEVWTVDGDGRRDSGYSLQSVGSQVSESLYSNQSPGSVGAIGE